MLPQDLISSHTARSRNGYLIERYNYLIETYKYQLIRTYLKNLILKHVGILSITQASIEIRIYCIIHLTLLMSRLQCMLRWNAFHAYLWNILFMKYYVSCIIRVLIISCINKSHFYHQMCHKCYYEISVYDMIASRIGILVWEHLHDINAP